MLTAERVVLQMSHFLVLGFVFQLNLSMFCTILFYKCSAISESFLVCMVITEIIQIIEVSHRRLMAHLDRDFSRVTIKSVRNLLFRSIRENLVLVYQKAISFDTGRTRYFLCFKCELKYKTFS